MGNQMCCNDVNKPNDFKPIPQIPKQNSSKIDQRSSEPVSDKLQEIKLPQLSPLIKDHLASEKPFAKELQQNSSINRFGADIFVGPIDSKGRPNGYGKMYKKDGSLFIGKFQEGMANGPGRYIMEDGSYYAGNFINNKASDENGIFIRENPYLQYRGGIKDNQFHGQGFEKGRKYQFKGQYQNGIKKNGELKWDTVSGNDGFQYEYIGPFDEKGLFHGKGILRQIKGDYEGQFYHGKKHGKGVYKYKSEIRYEGQYKNGLKNGEGTIYNADGRVSYKGQWKDGIPHGKGQIYDDKGQGFQAQIVEGIDKQHL